MPELPPLWIAFPHLTPADSLTQGEGEFYIDNWLPFWLSLSAQEQAAYLDRWNASPEWRQAIVERYDPAALDRAADLRDSEDWARRHPRPAPPPSWFARWFGRKR